MLKGYLCDLWLSSLRILLPEWDEDEGFDFLRLCWDAEGDEELEEDNVLIVFE